MRWTPGEAQARYAAVEARLENAALRQGPYLQGNGLAAFKESQRFYQQFGVEGGWDLDVPGGNGRLRLGGEVQARRYPETPLLAGRYQGVLARYTAPGWRLEARWGQDQARSSARSGGDQQRQGVLLGRVIQQGDHQWRFDYEYERVRDRSGYSPILENDRVRRTGKNLYRIEYSR